jgi:hypothetical protein
VDHDTSFNKTAGAYTNNNELTVASGATLSIISGGTLDLNPTSVVTMHLGSTADFAELDVSDGLSLGGTLAVLLDSPFAPALGDSFDILDWGSLSGTFDTLALPALAPGLSWNTLALYTSGVLSVIEGPGGDFNGDGSVDAADYVVWRKGLGTTFGPHHYDEWRANFGTSPGAGGVAGGAQVPEPLSLFLLIVAVMTSFSRSGFRTSRIATRDA